MTPLHDVEPITAEALAALVDRETARAREAGCCHIRNPEAFQAHLIAVARRARSVARRLADVMPAEQAPDPVATYVAGAWHDGGKIWNGDDYHEITGAVEVLDHGVEWGLAKGAPDAVASVLSRAARAILPHFAIYEQWQTTYVPSQGHREAVEPFYRRLTDMLCGAAADPEREDLLLPGTIEALIVTYSDMLPADNEGGADVPFTVAFERRWRDVERHAASHDPALVPLLPAVRPRIQGGCAFIEGILTTGVSPPGGRPIDLRRAP